MSRTVSISLLAAMALAACKGGVSMSGGGVELVYDQASIPDDTRAAALAESAHKIATARLAALKIPAVVRVDGRKLRVGLPAGGGTSRAEDAKAVLAISGNLEFREVQDAAYLKELGSSLGDEGPVKVTRDTWADANGNPRGCFMIDASNEGEALKVFPKEKIPSGVELMAQQGQGGADERTVMLAVGAPLFGGDVVVSARAVKDPVGTPVTILRLSPEGGKKLEEATQRIKGKKLAIVLDGRVYSTPVVLMPMVGGEIQLPQADAGERKARERAADILAAALNSGALPAPLKLMEERKVEKR